MNKVFFVFRQNLNDLEIAVNENLEELGDNYIQIKDIKYEYADENGCSAMVWYEDQHPH